MLTLLCNGNCQLLSQHLFNGPEGLGGVQDAGALLYFLSKSPRTRLTCRNWNCLRAQKQKQKVKVFDSHQHTPRQPNNTLSVVVCFEVPMEVEIVIGLSQTTRFPLTVIPWMKAYTPLFKRANAGRKYWRLSIGMPMHVSFHWEFIIWNNTHSM